MIIAAEERIFPRRGQDFNVNGVPIDRTFQTNHYGSYTKIPTSGRDEPLISVEDASKKAYQVTFLLILLT
jgi:hypothetical protein